MIKSYCKYCEVVDWWKGGRYAECMLKKQGINDENENYDGWVDCENCSNYEFTPTIGGLSVCLDLSKGEAIEDCFECDEKECTGRFYFELTGEKTVSEEDAVNLFINEEISRGKLRELLDVSYHDMIEILKKYDVELTLEL